MDLATLIGFISAVSVLIMAILQGGSLSMMINVPSILIVFCGSAGVVMMKFSLGQFSGAIKIALKALFHKAETMGQLIEQLMNLAQEARKGGVLALENVEIKNPFLKQGVQYLVDGLEPEVVEHTMMKDLTQTLERHNQGQHIFKTLGEVAPAMGMIGTLIGLVQMLSNMSDPKSIGPAMAVAMLTTLYGASLAHLVALPIADKLALRSREERINKSLIIDAVLGIQSGQNPRILQELLKTYLPCSKREIGEGEAAGENA